MITELKMQQRFDTRKYSVRDFEEWNEKGELILSPKFQRRDVWSPKVRSYLYEFTVDLLQDMPDREVYDVFARLNTYSTAHSQEKVKNLTRNKLGIYPSNLTVGGFLAMTVPSTSPPESFLESYLSKILFAAQRIVPN
jgi:hypothetical protein